jgi:hypothetical protein
LFCFGLTELAKNGVYISTESSDHLFQLKLQLEYANKKIKFEDLKYNQFVAGEMEIIIACKNDKEKTGRLRLLKKI